MAFLCRPWTRLPLVLSSLCVRSSAGVRLCSSSENNEVALQEKSKSDVAEYVTPDELVRYHHN